MKFCQEGKRRFSDEFAEKIFQKQRVWWTSVNVFKGETMRLFSQPLVKKSHLENFFRARTDGHVA